MRRAAALAFLVLAACGGSISARVNETRRADQSAVTWFAIAPSGPSYAVVLYLDGSGCASVTRLMPYLRVIANEGVAVAVSEKRGVEIDSDGRRCSDEFLATNDRLQRVADASLVISDLRTRLPGWNGKLVIIGASEGAAIAPEIALAHQDALLALILLAGGGLNQATELRMLAERRGEDVNALEERFEAIAQAPTSTQTWLGHANTYRRWASYLQYRPIDYVVQITKPILVVHGGRDDASPIESSEQMVRALEENGRDVTFHRHDELDHRWNDEEGDNHFRDVALGVLQWLNSRLE